MAVVIAHGGCDAAGVAVPIRETATLRAPRPSPTPGGGSAGDTVGVSTYRRFAAPPMLARVVACTWEGRPVRPRSLRVVPDGGTDLAWDGRGVRVARALPGPARHPVDGDAERVGLRLRPGWATTVLGVPVAGLPPLADLADILGPARAGTVEDRLGAATTAADRRELLAGLVAGLLGPGTRPGPDPRVVAAVDLLGRPGASVAAVAGDVGLSPRQLRRRVEHHVGLTPKALQVVLRFQRFMSRTGTATVGASAAGAGPAGAVGTGMAAGGGTTGAPVGGRVRGSTRAPAAMPAAEVAGAVPGSLARAAAECGYADQSHLARDCRRLAGLTPAALMRPPHPAGPVPAGDRPARR